MSDLCDRALYPTKLKVVFLDKRRVLRWVNGDAPRSVCSQFIRWVRPDLTEEELRQHYPLIRVWEYQSAFIFSMDAQLKEAPNRLGRVFEGQFMTATRRDQRVGICYGVQKITNGSSHALLFVYDAPNKRLEIYDPNGRDTLYLRPPQPGRTIYDYFIRNQEYYRDQLAVCKIWSPAHGFQHENKSCGWWAVVIGLERMAGVHRRYLITDFRDLRSVMASIFSVMKSVCKFDNLTSCPHTIKDVDRALFRCVVPEERIAEIRALVTLPRSMFDDSPDVELCAESSGDDSSDSDDVPIGELAMYESRP